MHDTLYDTLLSNALPQSLAKTNLQTQVLINDRLSSTSSWPNNYFPI